MACHFYFLIARKKKLKIKTEEFYTELKHKAFFDIVITFFINYAVKQFRTKSERTQRPY